MISKLSNGRLLVVTSRDLAASSLDNSWIPCVILLTARTAKEASIGYWEYLVRLFLERGVEYFLCIGTFSEHLHDAIDDYLYQYDDENNTTISVNIVTTYHANESCSDIFDYFAYATEIRDKEKGRLLAILDDSSDEDHELLEALKKA